jgi:hypothetical protein
MLESCKNSEEKVKKAKVDVGRLADELVLSKTMQMFKKRQKGQLRIPANLKKGSRRMNLI